jgi:DNA-binding FadR family transcriptional regulator
MSRTTVREALRILEVQGLVRIKTGRSGGAFVQKPGRNSVASSVALLIRGRQILLTDLLATREAVEPYCARLAAERRTDEDLRRLDVANADIAADGTLEDFLRANLDWHVGVTIAGRNELLIGFMSALSHSIYTATNNQGFVDEKVRRTTTKAHVSITDAIRAGDADAAVRRMTRHLHTSAEAVVKVEERTAIEVQ